MASVDVLNEGVLYLSRNPSTVSKDWIQRLFVLKFSKESDTATLEYYKDKKKRWQKQDPVGMIHLWPSIKLSLAHECSYKFPLKLVTNGQTYYLSASSFSGMNSWYRQIQLTQILKKPGKGFCEYEVRTKPSDSMKLIEASGSCVLALTPDYELVCASLPQRQVLGVWPYSCLRGYWCKESVFGFEAGRRSPRGEGMFEFFTTKNEEIYRNLENSISQVRQGETRPPLPPPSETRKSSTPPVSTSESEEEQPAPVTSRRLPQKAASVRVASSGAPSHLRRVQSHLGKGNSKWLHESCDPNVFHPPPVGSRSLSPLSDEDTYSRTVHTYRNSLTEDPPRQTYQRLHSHEAVPVGLPSLALSNLAEEDMRVYDVAYPEASKRPPIALPNDQYSSLAAPDPSRVVRPVQTQGASSAVLPHQFPVQHAQVAATMAPVGGDSSLVPGLSGPNLIPVERNGLELSDDQLTPNPMYGSRENLLMALHKLQAPPSLPPRNWGMESTDSGLGNRRMESTDSGLGNRGMESTDSGLGNRGMENIDLGLQDLGISPAYEFHSLSREQTPAQPITAQEEDGSVFDDSSVKNGEELSNDCEDAKSSEPKSTKPYSKVKKKPAVKEEEEEVLRDDETPPPLPARLYSVESTGSDPPNVDN